MDVERAKYEDLLDSLSDDSGWSDKDTYDEFKEYLDSNYSDRADGDTGYEALLSELSEDTSDQDEVYQKFRILGMAYKHTDGSWRSFNFENKLVWCQDDEPTTNLDTWFEVEEEEEGAADDLARDELGRIRDPETGLLYDEESWYTPDGVLVEFNPTGMGFDEEAGLLFDATSYYTPKHVPVTISPDDRTWSYDADGKWYERGILSESAASSQEPAVASTAPVAESELERVDSRRLWRHTQTGAYYANNRNLGRKVIVYYNPGDQEWSWDDDGLWYQWGELYEDTANEEVGESQAREITETVPGKTELNAEVDEGQLDDLIDKEIEEVLDEFGELEELDEEIAGILAKIPEGEQAAELDQALRDEITS